MQTANGTLHFCVLERRRVHSFLIYSTKPFELRCFCRRNLRYLEVVTAEVAEDSNLVHVAPCGLVNFTRVLEESTGLPNPLNIAKPEDMPVHHRPLSPVSSCAASRHGLHVPEDGSTVVTRNDKA